ncbi:MAG: hypothetical protein H6729_00120 [Deltaproteobacteria bacterium]|nr:hypothetical protein [Deltaproteobacteria bacterium]
MIVSTSRLQALAAFSKLEAGAGADRDLATRDVEIFLEVLWAEATENGRVAYEGRISELDPDDYPWSAVRPAEHTGIGPIEGQISFAPPALSLALARRPDLEPEQPGDELPDPAVRDTAYQALFDAWWNWDADTVLSSITNIGWTVPDESDDRTSADLDVQADVFAGRGDEQVQEVPTSNISVPTDTPGSEGRRPVPTAPSSPTHNDDAPAWWQTPTPYVIGGLAVLTGTAGVIALRGSK